MIKEHDEVSFGRILALAFPVVVSQASESVMLFVDRLFLSVLGKEYLAAAMSGGLTSFVFSTFFASTVGYVNAIVAQYYGAGKRTMCAKSAIQTLYASIAGYPVMLALIPLIRIYFSHSGHSPVQTGLEFEYYRALAIGSLLFIFRSGIAGFFIGTGKTAVVMAANIAAMVVNIPCNYVLIYGKLGFPALGMTGAALGTIMGSLTSLLILLVFYFSEKTHSAYGTRGELGPDKVLFKKLLKFGLPAGSESFLAVLAFNIFIQLMHSYSENVAAAITITFNWDLVAFIPMVGLSHAVTALTGQRIGAGDPEGAKRTAYRSLRIGFTYSGTMMLLFIFAAPVLVGFFTNLFPDSGTEVGQTSVTFLRLAGLYTLADSTQLVFAGSLRGAGDTAWVMRVIVGLHWIFASVVIVLIKVLKAGPLTVWIIFIVFVFSIGISMFLRFRGGKWRNIRVI